MGKTVLYALALLGTSSVAAPESKEDTVSLLTRMKHELGEAYVNGDVATLERI